MKNLFAENGLSKMFIFMIFMILPLFAGAAFVYISFNDFNLGNILKEKISFLAVTFWIFFGVKSKDVFDNDNGSSLKPKHIMMLATYLTMFFINSNSDLSSIIWILNIPLIAHRLSEKYSGQGLYWQSRINSAGFSKEKVLESVKKEFFITESIVNKDSYTIKGYGLFSLKISIEVTDSSLHIKTEPLISGLNFWFGLKVMPFNLGDYYGEKVLKHMGVIQNESHLIASTTSGV